MNKEPFECSLDSSLVLKMYLFKNVKNIKDIKSKVIEGKWKCAAINPSLILDVHQVAVAANRAAIASTRNCLVTKTIFSEILFNLSLSSNITQSLQKFGITNDKNILLCFFKHNEDQGEDISEIEGEQCPITDLYQFSNLKDIKSVYKLNTVGPDVDLLDVIVSRIVTKGIISF